jgi:hypothetical protein
VDYENDRGRSLSAKTRRGCPFDGGFCGDLVPFQKKITFFEVGLKTIYYLCRAKCDSRAKGNKGKRVKG